MTSIDDFFTAYKNALLTRDAEAVAELYAVPGLIVFPGNSVVVSEAQQTAEFFAGAWGQYDEIDEIEAATTIIATAPASTWVGVTWTYGGAARERFCYQLVPNANGYQIAVLTPMAIDE